MDTFWEKYLALKRAVVWVKFFIILHFHLLIPKRLLLSSHIGPFRVRRSLQFFGGHSRSTCSGALRRLIFEVCRCTDVSVVRLSWHGGNWTACRNRHSLSSRVKRWWSRRFRAVAFILFQGAESVGHIVVCKNTASYRYVLTPGSWSRHGCVHTACYTYIYDQN